MIIYKIDETGEELSQTELSNLLGCSNQWISWRSKNRQDKNNHFQCRGYGITIIQGTKYKSVREQNRAGYLRNRERILERQRRNYPKHKPLIVKWRKEHMDKVRESNEKWRKAHQDWYNAYYREKRRQKREQDETDRSVGTR